MDIILESTGNAADITDSPGKSVVERVNWFELLYGQCLEGWISIWHLPERETTWFHLSDKEAALAKAHELSNFHKDVYFGLGLRKERLAAGRGRLEDISCISCLWADIDIQASAHAAQNYPDTLEDAIELAYSYPLPPSIIIKSANGLHAYWLLQQPWYFSTEEERIKAQSLMQSFQSYLRRKAGQNGWKVDNTSDLPRVLRVPGTNNYKNPAQPVEVVFLENHPERRYDRQDFALYLESEQIVNADGYQVQGDVRCIIDNCAFIQHCRDNAVCLPESDWFAMVSNLCRSQNGTEVIHQFSRPYEGYSAEETNKKIIHCLEDSGPHTCQYIQGEIGFNGCPTGGCGVKAPAAMATSAVFKARQEITKLMDEPDQISKAVYNVETINALAILKARNKAEFGKAMVRIKENSGKSLNLKHVEAAVDERVRSDQQQKSQNIGNMFEGLKYDFVAPEHWIVNEQGIQAWMKEGQINISPVPITIATRLKNIDTNTEKAVLLFKRDGKWQTIRAERSTIYSKSKIIDLADYGLPVTSETAKYLVNYLAAVEASNPIPVMHTVNRLGWLSDKEFIPGLSDVILDVEGGGAKLANAFRPAGTLLEWVELVKPLRDTSLGRFILSAGFAAPMMEKLRQRIFAIHIWGDSRAGKSAAAKVALSVWGNPSEGMMTFNTTKVGLEQQVGFLSNLPLVIDEKQIVAEKQAFVESMMYMLGEGKGKTRGAKGGGLADYKSWRTLAITTGEHPMSSDNSATGVKTRVLELHSESVVPEGYGSTLHQQLETIHGTAGPAFISRLLEYPESTRLYDCIRQKLQQEAPELMGSHHGALALVACADVLVAQWIFGEDEDTAMQNCWVMLENIVRQLETKEEADEATRALMHFRSWRQENARRFSSDGHHEYGWLDNDDENIVYVNSGTFTRAMKDGGFNAIRVKTDFIARQWLVPHINAKGEQFDYKSKRNPDGKNATVIEICLPALV